MDEKKVQEPAKKIIGKGRKALRYGVNIFVYTFVSIFMLLMIFFGISQTSFFKNWLRDTVVEMVNDEINGKLSIEEIDGTIFTSLIIKNVTLTSLQKDTVISARNIELRTSPLKILFKNIYIRKFELKDARIRLVTESDGELNLLKIFPPSDEPEDTTTSEFPFTIEVADFALTNVDFSMQRYDKVGSTEYYKSINPDDLRITDLNVSFNAFADLNKYAYRLSINNISFNPNFNFFQLQHLSGNILLSPQLAGINKLHLITKDSDIELSAAILGVDFLENFSMDKLKTAPVRVSLNSTKLNVDDISTYVPAMKMFDGIISADLEGSGTFSELSLKKFYINYNNTLLKASGVLKNLLDKDKMNFNISITDSYIDPSDPNKLLRDLELPEYMEFGVFKIDTLNYNGGPLDFKTTFAIRTDKGNLNGTANIDLRSEEMIYDAKIITKNLDIGPFTSISTDMNSEINISGVGFDLQKMKLDVSVDAASSKFGEKYLKNISVSTFAENGLMKTTLIINSDSTTANILANIDFKNLNDPAYEVKGNLNGINLARLLSNKSLESNLNLTIDASGQGFNPDSMDLFLVTDIQNSNIFNFDIDSTRLIMDIRRNDNGKKIINIISDIADLTISGDYQITSLGKVLAREGEIIQAVISEKINPVFFPEDSIFNLDQQNLVVEQHAPVEDFSLEYLLDFKEAMNIDIGKDRLELDGQIDGFMKSVDDSLTVNLNSKFDYLKFWDEKDVFFLVNSNLTCDLSNHLLDGYSGDMTAVINFKADRIYAVGNIYNVSSAISLENDDLKFSLDAKYEENIKTSLNGFAVFAGERLDVNIDKFKLVYNELNISNKKNLLLSYTNQSINFDDFVLQIADGTLTASGSFGAVGEHNAIITVDSLSGSRTIKDIMGNLGQKEFNASITMDAKLHGNFSDPKFEVVASVKNIQYGDGNFGSFLSTFSYSDNSLVTDIRFLDSTQNYDAPALLITGMIPINLTSQKDSLIKSSQLIDLTIQSDEYDLSSLKDIFPYVQFQTGKLESDIYLSGTISKPVAIGYLSLNDATFKLKYNNLDYDVNTKVWIDDEEITIESIVLKNVFGTRQGGTLNGSGFVRLDEFKLDSAYIKVNGDLKVLDMISKSASPLVYGDLAIATRGDIVYSAKREKSYLNMPIAVTVADLVIPLGKSAYSSSSGFIYRYSNQGTFLDRLASELDSLIQLTSRGDSLVKIITAASKLNYTLDIKLETEAEVLVVLSKELDQNLVVILDGDFFLESIDGKTKSGGELKVLEGSTLSFIKTFDAEGNIKFDKISDPIINITSTYKNYWLKDPNDPSTEQEVAIKIKLKGPLSELDRNFISDENNVGVYMGRQNIQDDKKDPGRNVTDAMYFLILNKFPDDKPSEQDQNLIASTSTELAGSMLGGFLNNYLGDYVRGVELRQTGSETRFNLMGKAWLFKYEIGGSTEVLQDLSRANIRIDLPLTSRLQLKFERKRSENENPSSNNPLFFEGGVNYIFEF